MLVILVLKALCGGQTEKEQNKLQVGGQCKSIENLLIRETKITQLEIQLAFRKMSDQ